MVAVRLRTAIAKAHILTPPHHAYTERLLASVPEMDSDWLDGVLAN